ncbi:hypothetical protein R3P38DRAFT_3257768 [Favolaschia claudopus]|uniref:Uncharacterized protein n=1 Tax=Favolaschia claudopus TaxID=2862362 RepID=A0AAW0D4L2_9AGAR
MIHQFNRLKVSPSNYFQKCATGYGCVTSIDSVDISKKDHLDNIRADFSASPLNRNPLPEPEIWQWLMQMQSVRIALDSDVGGDMRKKGYIITAHPRTTWERTESCDNEFCERLKRMMIEESLIAIAGPSLARTNAGAKGF